jgi:hypothetical protein
MAPERATSLPAHAFPTASLSKRATPSTSKGVFAITAYLQSPVVAGFLLESSAQTSSLYTFINRPGPALLPSHSPTTQLQQRAFSKGGE